MTSLATLGENEVEGDAFSASTHLIRTELHPEKGLKVQRVAVPVKFLSFFWSGRKRRLEKERDRARLPVPHVALAPLGLTMLGLLSHASQ